MASYGLAIVTYGFVLVLMVVIMVNTYLQQWQLGGTAVILTALLGLYLLRGNINRVKMINEAYERTLQFERWRNRTLHTDTSSEAELSSEQTRWTFTQKALLLAVIVALFLPYSYQAGGTFTVYPVEREVLTTDVPGIIEAVFYDGGETLKKGTPLARLQVVDLSSQIAVLNAQIAEQKAVVQDLKARPKPEEVQVAQQQLEVARSQAKYSRERVPRLQKMYDDHTISFEDLDAAKKQADVDAQQVVEREANLALVKAGVTPDHIAAEEAKLQAFVEQRTEVQKKIDRTVITMPFDGSLLTLHLKQRVNSYLDKGQPFASVENAGTVTMEIDVPESDAGYVKVGAKVKARPTSFSERTYEGVVKVIDPNVTIKPMGNYIKVIAEMQNPQHDLRTSMTGYAKIEGMTLPVWKAFSLAVIRFFNVQVWSWIP
jgi:putative peptide zinc metalloprotease protein